MEAEDKGICQEWDRRRRYFTRAYSKLAERGGLEFLFTNAACPLEIFENACAKFSVHPGFSFPSCSYLRSTCKHVHKRVIYLPIGEYPYTHLLFVKGLY